MKKKFILIVFLFSVNIYADANEDLMKAVRIGNLDLVLSALQNGADPNVKDNQEKPPLSIATEKGYLEIVQALLEKGAKVNAVEKNNKALGWTALMYAVETGNFELVKLLLAKGANKKQKNGKGYDAIYLSELLGQNEISSLLRGDAATRKKYHLSEIILSQKEIKLEIKKRNLLQPAENEKIIGAHVEL